MSPETLRELRHCLGLCAIIVAAFTLLVSCAAPRVTDQAVTSRPPFPWELAAPALARTAAAPAPAPTTNTVRLVWDQPGACGGWTVEVSHDLRTWTVLTNLPAPAPSSAWGTLNVTSPAFTVTSPAFFRVAARP